MTLDSCWRRSERWPASELHVLLYCARGEMGNRLEEQVGMSSGRLGTQTLRANLLRLYFSSLTYVLVHAPRRLAVMGTESAVARVGTIRLRLLKID